jgi:hypothetical protein
VIIDFQVHICTTIIVETRNFESSPSIIRLENQIIQAVFRQIEPAIMSKIQPGM